MNYNIIYTTYVKSLNFQVKLWNRKCGILYLIKYLNRSELIVDIIS